MGEHPMRVAYIGLGSNLEDPRRQVTQALREIAELPGSRLDAASSLYASRPLGPADQPDYVNAVARLLTRIAPLELLDRLQAIEREHRRVRGERWGPRTLDLDLLLYDDQTIEHQRLTVPHPGMHRRAFVLLPLLEIAPDLVVPGRGVAKSLLRRCEDPGVYRL